MQKKIIALAVAALASGAAFAQSNVTLYGVADASFDVVRASGDKTPADKINSFSRVSTNSSLLGFKGSEDLGDGIKALFQLEGGASFDSGAAFSFNRDSYVALEGGFGRVALGNLTGPARALQGALDVNVGNTGIGSGAALVGKLGGYLIGGFNSAAPVVAAGAAVGTGPVNMGAACGRSSTCTSPFDTRYNNAISYVTPNLSGFTATVVYVANENRTRDGEAAATKANSKAYDLGAKYDNGPIMVGATYTQAKIGDPDDAKAQDVRLGGAYNFGPASARLIFESTKVKDNTGTDIKQNVWGIGATYNVTAPAKLTAQYYKANDLKIAGLSVKDTGAKLFSIGCEYSLSKRTMLKLVVSRLANDDGAAYDYGLNAVGVNRTAFNDSTGAGLTDGLGTKLTGIQMGIRHAF